MEKVTHELKQLRKLASLLQSAWFYGDWKAETLNESEMEAIMREQGLWPVTLSAHTFEPNLNQHLSEVNGGENNGMNNNPDMNKNSTVTEKCSKHECLPYNPNEPSLDTITFKFEQESNCVDGGEGETLIVEAKSSLGIDGDGGAFYVLRTEQWVISDIEDIIRTLKRVEVAIKATNPTSIHI